MRRYRCGQDPQQNKSAATMTHTKKTTHQENSTGLKKQQVSKLQQVLT